MEAAGETCKLCLKYIQGANLAVLDETLLGKLEFLQMDLDQSVEESNSVCKECEEKIENAFDFKSCLVNTESCLVPYVSEDKTQKVNLRVIVEKDSPSSSAGESSAEKEVCRLCKNFVDAIAVISLPKILKDDSMMEVFQGHIPEMDLEVTENPVVCESCQKSLASFSTLIASWSIANGWNDDEDDEDMKEDLSDFEVVKVKKETNDEFSDSNTNSSVGIVDISDSAKTGRKAKSKNGQTDKVKSESEDLSDSSESAHVAKKFKSEEAEDESMEDLQLKNEEVEIKDEDGSINDKLYEKNYNSLHRANKGAKKIFPCDFCNIDCESISGYRDHVYSVHATRKPRAMNYKIHKCPKCDFYCDKSAIYLNHLGANHGLHLLPQSKPTKILKCIICDLSFNKNPDYMKHLSTEHRTEESQDTVFRKKCRQCEFHFSTQPEYMRHLTSEHRLENNETLLKRI